MKSFLKANFYFLIVLIIINVVFSFLINALYAGNYKDHSLDFDSYLLADSHGVSLKNFTEKYGIYNFSEGSDSYFDMKRKLNYLLNHSNIDTLYITVDDHTLSIYREKMNNLDWSTYFTTPEDYSNIYYYIKEKYIVGKIAFFQTKTRSVIRYYVYSKIKTLFKKNKYIQVGCKTPWHEIAIGERIKESKNRFQLQFPSINKSTKLEKSLLEIINICKKNNILLIGIKFPLSIEYISTLGNRTYKAEEIFKMRGLQVLDCKSLYIDQSEYFANQDHLNEKGAYEFVELIFKKSKRMTCCNHHLND